MVKRAVPLKRSSMKEGVAAAELALKAHVLGSNSEILAEMSEGDRMMQEIAAMVDLTQAHRRCSLQSCYRPVAVL